MAIKGLGGFEDGTILGDSIISGGTFSIVTSPVNFGTYALRTNPTTTGTGYALVGGWASLGQETGLSAITSFNRFYFRFATLPASGDEPIAAISSNNTAAGPFKLEVRINSSGQLVAYDTTPTLLATGTTVLSANTWYMIECKAGKGASAPWEVKINGTSEISGTSSNLISANSVGIFLGKVINRNGNSVDFFYDDWVIDDATYPGASQLAIMKVTGAGTYTAWTGAYTNINPIPAQTTTFISTSSVGAATFTLQSAAAAGISGTILAVRACAYVSDSGGSSLLRVRFRSATTDTDTTDNNASGSGFSLLSNVFTTNPATSSAWSVSDLASIEVGVYSNNTTAVKCSSAYVLVLFAPSLALSPGVSTRGTTTSSSLSFSASDASAGTGPYTYQWQRSTDYGATWNNISAATTLSLTDSTVALGAIYSYRLRYIDSAGSPATVYSNAISACTGPGLANGTQDINGWVIYTPSTASQFVYLLSTGNDSTATVNNPSLPFATLANAYAAMRTGQPDWLIILDAPAAGFGNIIWAKSGLSATEKMVITSGSATRSIINISAIATVVQVVCNSLSLSVPSRNPYSSQFVTVSSSIFGINFNSANSNGLVFQDCVSSYSSGNTLEDSTAAGFSNCLLHRCNFFNNFHDPISAPHGQGLFSFGGDGMIFRQGYSDYNGWNETWVTLPGTTIATWAAITTGQFAVTYDGTVYQVTGCNFAAATTMANVATILTTRMVAAGATVTAKWDATAGYMIFVGVDEEALVTTVATGSGGGVNITGSTLLNAPGQHLAAADIFCRNFYIDTTNFQLINSFNLRSCSEGFQLRGGGIVQWNVMWSNVINGWMEMAGTTNLIADNLFDGTHATADEIWSGRGDGVYLLYGDGDTQATYQPTPIAAQRNIFVNSSAGAKVIWTFVDTTKGAAANVGAMNIDISSNVIVNWNAVAMNIDTTDGTLNIANNTLQQTTETTVDLIQLASAYGTLSGNRFSGGDATPFQVGSTNYNLANFQTATGQTVGSFVTLSYPDPTNLLDTIASATFGYANFKAFRRAIKGRGIREWKPEYDATVWVVAARKYLGVLSSAQALPSGLSHGVVLGVFGFGFGF